MEYTNYNTLHFHFFTPLGDNWNNKEWHSIIIALQSFLYRRSSRPLYFHSTTVSSPYLLLYKYIQRVFRATLAVVHPQSSVPSTTYYLYLWFYCLPWNLSFLLPVLVLVVPILNLWCNASGTGRAHSMYKVLCRYKYRGYCIFSRFCTQWNLPRAYSYLVRWEIPCSTNGVCSLWTTYFITSKTDRKHDSSRVSFLTNFQRIYIEFTTEE